jgi:enoyl-CoA hydratase/carnithine racemase
MSDMLRVMSEPPVLVHRDGPVATITLNRPQAMNAITTALAVELSEALERCGEEAGVVVIRGAGGNFCVGGDFHELERLRADGPAAMAELFAAFGRACEAVGRVSATVVCAVEGYATAGGFELLQAADVVIVTDEAKLADNHSNYGQVPGGGGSQRLPRLVGRQRAGAHILTGDRLRGPDAVAWGLAYRSVPAARFDEALDELVGRLAAKSPQAQAQIKRLLRDGLELSLAEGLALERRAVVSHLTGPSAAAGIAAFTGRDGR